MEEKQEGKSVTIIRTENETEYENMAIDTYHSASEGGEGSSFKRMKTGLGASSNACSSLRFKKLAPFVEKIWDMMENKEKSIVSWNSTGTSLVIWNTHSFAADVLPLYFKHNNFQSFVCQLNSYGFKKLTWDRWEYGNEYFRKGEMHLLEHIKRRVQFSRRVQPALRMIHPDQTSGSSVGTSTHASPTSNINKEIETSMKQHDLLKQEITKLKSRQGNLEEKIASLENEFLTNKQNNKMMLKLVATWINHLQQRKLSNTNRLPILVHDEEMTHEEVKEEEKTEDGSAETEPNKEATKINCDLVSCTKPQEQDAGSSSMEHTTDFMSESFSQLEKMVAMDEQETGKSSTFIPLEDLFGDSPEWAEYVKRMS